VSSPNPAWFLSALETVPIETPARLATSRIVMPAPTGRPRPESLALVMRRMIADLFRKPKMMAFVSG
jgi:hypothetical protein